MYNHTIKIKDQIVTNCFSYVFLNEDIQDASSSDFREILEPTMAPYLLSSLDLWVINLVPLNFGRCEHPIGQAIICSFIWASEKHKHKKKHCPCKFMKQIHHPKTKVNVREGIYTAVVALVSLLTFSTVISFMTSLIGTLQHKRMEEKLGLDSSVLVYNNHTVTVGWFRNTAIHPHYYMILTIYETH